MCFQPILDDSRTACAACGYLPLALSPFDATAGPSTPRLKQCVALLKGGMTPHRAAKCSGLASQTALNAYLRYIVAPEWAAMKRDAEEYSLTAPDAPAAA